MEYGNSTGYGNGNGISNGNGNDIVNGNGIGKCTGNGNGFGNGLGYIIGNGPCNIIGNGHDIGNGHGNGSSNNHGIGNGHGDGNDYGIGNGHGDGNGYGHGVGNGHGNGNGYVNGNGAKVKKMKPMDSEVLREQGHIMVDFIADYYKNLEDSPQDFPVLSQVQPGYLRDMLPDSAPDHPESLKELLDDVSKKIIPGVTHWQSPSYFAYYASSTSVAGFLGEMLNAGLSVVGFTWLTSPAATELEVIVLDWLAKLLQLPNHFLSTGS